MTELSRYHLLHLFLQEVSDFFIHCYSLLKIQLYIIPLICTLVAIFFVFAMFLFRNHEFLVVNITTPSCQPISDMMVFFWGTEFKEQ